MKLKAQLDGLQNVLKKSEILSEQIKMTFIVNVNFKTFYC